MAQEYLVRFTDNARSEALALVRYVAQQFGDGYADLISARILEVTDILSSNPTRHMRIRFLIGRQFEYRRVLVGKNHRIIFAINEADKIVEVVRIDLQSSDPQLLDDLP